MIVLAFDPPTPLAIKYGLCGAAVNNRNRFLQALRVLSFKAIPLEKFRVAAELLVTNEVTDFPKRLPHADFPLCHSAGSTLAHCILSNFYLAVLVIFLQLFLKEQTTKQKTTQHTEKKPKKKKKPTNIIGVALKNFTPKPCYFPRIAD
jgi:hypothetical protein